MSDTTEKKEKKVLVEVKNLKKYFPIRRGVLQRQVGAVQEGLHVVADLGEGGLVHDVGVSVTLRNIMRIEDLGLANPSADQPEYGVVTRGISADLQLDNMRACVPHFNIDTTLRARFAAYEEVGALEAAA